MHALLKYGSSQVQVGIILVTDCHTLLLMSVRDLDRKSQVINFFIFFAIMLTMYSIVFARKFCINHSWGVTGLNATLASTYNCTVVCLCATLQYCHAMLCF